MRLVVFGHNDWWIWEDQGFCTRNAALMRAMAVREDVAQLLIVDSPRFGSRTHRPAARRHEDVSPVSERVGAVRYGYPLPFPSTWRPGRRVNEQVARGALLRRLAGAARGSGPTVLWVADPRLVEAALEVPYDVFVFDAIDDWRHHAWAGLDAVSRGYEVAARRADVVFAVNPSLLESLRPAGHAEALFNAVDSGPWQAARPAAELAGLPRPLVGYVGMIQQRLDAPLLAAVARLLPRVTFCLVGEVFDDYRASLSGLPANVHLLGSRPYAQVPDLVAGFDACIVPHLRDAMTGSMDPLKLYEYLAAGRPTVSTVTSPNPAVAAQVRVVRAPDAFAAAITEEIAADDEARREARREAVRGETWPARAARALHVIGEAAGR
jgi:glycosyltransferase involved in cell wall biosynthesis